MNQSDTYDGNEIGFSPFKVLPASAARDREIRYICEGELQILWKTKNKCFSRGVANGFSAHGCDSHINKLVVSRCAQSMKTLASVYTEKFPLRLLI
jgi:hypothetical protein